MVQKKILIIEDDKDLVEIIKLHLEKEGYETDYAYDGQEALKKIDYFKPDLIILDVMVPKMNGAMINTQLKNNSKTKDIPIIVITGKMGAKELFLTGQQLNVSAFFYKPVLISEIVNEIKKLLKQ
ncbi:MAG: response regulator transcription factor [Endomicrobiia bacterium]